MRSEYDFLQFCKDNSIPYREYGQDHHSRVGWVQVECVFCSKRSGSFHLGYSLFGKYMNCWKCGPHSLWTYIRERFPDMDRSTITKHVESMGSQTKQKPIEIKRGEYRQPRGVSDLQEPHENYLSDRDFIPESLVKLWHIGGIGVASRLSWRIFIPIEYQGDAVSWTTRSIDPDASVRYVSARPDEESICHKDLLYGEDYCRETIIVTEGPTDVWRIGPGAVSVMGISVKRSQIEKISKYPYRFVCFDNEPLAQLRARKLCENLSMFPGETELIRIESGKDVATCNIQEINAIRKLLQ